MSDLKEMREAVEADRRVGVDYYERVPFARYAALIACAEACERIMHARGNPSSPITNMGRSMMREIAGEALAALERVP